MVVYMTQSLIEALVYIKTMKETNPKSTVEVSIFDNGRIRIMAHKKRRND